MVEQPKRDDGDELLEQQGPCVSGGVGRHHGTGEEEEGDLDLPFAAVAVVPWAKRPLSWVPLAYPCYP